MKSWTKCFSIARGVVCIGVLSFYFVRLCDQSSANQVAMKVAGWKEITKQHSSGIKDLYLSPVAGGRQTARLK